MLSLLLLRWVHRRRRSRVAGGSGIRFSRRIHLLTLSILQLLSNMVRGYAIVVVGVVGTVVVTGLATETPSKGHVGEVGQIRGVGHIRSIGSVRVCARELSRGLVPCDILIMLKRGLEGGGLWWLLVSVGCNVVVVAGRTEMDAAAVVVVSTIAQRARHVTIVAVATMPSCGTWRDD